MLGVVITTIQEPTECVKQLNDRLVKQEIDYTLAVVGDRKGPKNYQLEGATFVSIEAQLASKFKLAPALPENHYARKNLGYLEVIKCGADVIYETDDDNTPNVNWQLRQSDQISGKVCRPTDIGWTNVYKGFTTENIWPRGLPLDQIRSKNNFEVLELENVYSPIQQGLVNLSPDVDATWRMIFGEHFVFDPQQNLPVVVPPRCWSPFNTQTTWFWPEAYPLLYIPSHCPFRMCDIWRSFIAQRCVWALDGIITFWPAEVDQHRNAHDLQHDFNDEIMGYKHNNLIKLTLDDLQLMPGAANVCDNLMKCYRALVQLGIFPEDELKLVQYWINDIVRLQMGGS